MKKPILAGLLAFGIFAFTNCTSNKTETAVETADTTENSGDEEQRPSPIEVKEGTIGSKSLKVQYGSPAVKGRTIWGDLTPYNVVWRTGANEATYVDFPQDVTIEGKALAAGKYSLFTIPKESGPWTVIFNSDWNLEHGHFQYDEKNDVLRVEVNPVWEENSTERLAIDIESPGLVVRWEKLKLPITIQ